jgi:adenosylcobyric acid synthase
VPVIGVCGGYQMLGRRILDPDAVESPATETTGLGMLEVATTFAGRKRTVRVSGSASGGALVPAGAELRGYEVHMGRTTLSPGVRPFAYLRDAGSGHVTHADGAVSADGQVCGTYVHGLFDAPVLRADFLNRLRAAAGLPVRSPAAAVSDIERLADHVEAHLDMTRLGTIIGLRW